MKRRRLTGPSEGVAAMGRLAVRGAVAILGAVALAAAGGCASPVDNTKGGGEIAPAPLAASGASGASGALAASGTSAASAPGGAAATIVARGKLEGFCEASAVIPWKGGYLIADNEEEKRLFWLAGEPQGDVKPAGQPFGPDYDVRDVESLVAVPGQGSGKVALIGSHSRSSDGSEKPKRRRLQVEGEKWREIDLSGCAECVTASALAPNAGGLSIEGAAMWGSTLWLGVRSPLRGDSALLLEMTGDLAKKDAIGVKRVVPVALDKQGVRDLVVRDGALFALAGPSKDAQAPHSLYRITDVAKPPERVLSGLPEYAEGIAPAAAPGEWLVVKDGDGKPDKPCVTPAEWFRIKP